MSLACPAIGLITLAIWIVEEYKIIVLFVDEVFSIPPQKATFCLLCS
jgi:hypothetical protein